MRVLSRAFARLGPLEPAFYVLWAAFSTLACARAFYGFMLKQTGGEWSAPLDDVFIHFDYARSTALGHPFEWVPGNGYSSGNTSLTYPFVLAFGWLVGFRENQLMIWAAVVAEVCVFGVLLATRRLFVADRTDAWGKLGSYLLPPVFLGVGALDWSRVTVVQMDEYVGLPPHDPTSLAWSLHRQLVGPLGLGFLSLNGPHGRFPSPVRARVKAWS